MQLSNIDFADYKKINLGLKRIKILLDRLNNPHLSLPPVIHVAGTNGKGSTLAYLESIFTSAKYKVHKFVSPHLVHLNERIILQGKEISNEYLDELTKECEISLNKPGKIDITFFELITVVAFLAFSRIKADIVLIETGMGGRLDATNVIENPFLAFITPISMDHTRFLGNNLEKIASEKAGIIKKNCQIIIGKQEKNISDLLENKCKSNNSKFLSYNKDWKISCNKNEETFDFFTKNKKYNFPIPNLEGRHQIENASAVIAALFDQNKFEIKEKDIIYGLKNVNWLGRLQKIESGKYLNYLPNKFELFLDGAHNTAGAIALSKWIIQSNLKYKHKYPTYLVCAMSKYDNSENFIKYLSGVVSLIIAVPIEGNDNSVNPEKVALIAKHNGVKSVVCKDLDKAFGYIKKIHKQKKKMINFFRKSSDNSARVIVSGSLYLVGKFLELNNE